MEGLRSFPIRMAGGDLERAFPDGNGLDDTARVDEVAADLLERAGLGSLSDDPYLGDTVRAEIDDAIRRTDETPPEYPYEYPSLESFVETNLAQDVDPGLVVDATSLLLLSSTYGESHIYDCSEMCGVPAEALAYTMLRVLAERDGATCESQLNLAYLVSLGLHAPYDGVEEEASKARDLCGDDPTPLWLLGTFAAGQATVVKNLLKMAHTSSELISASERAFEALREELPDSPLGWSGAADLYLKLADEAHGYAILPFQVRTWHARALAYYEKARTKSAAAGLLAGHARALSAVGRDEEAAAIARTLNERDPDWAPYQALLVQVLGAAADYDGVIEAREEAPEPSLPRRGTFALGDAYGFGLRGTRPDWSYDPSYDPMGGASSTDLSFLPGYGKGLSYGGCVEEAEVAALIATRQLDRAIEKSSGDDFGRRFGPGIDCSFEPIGPDSGSGGSDLHLIAIGELGNTSDRDAEIEDSYGPVNAGSLSSYYDTREAFWRSLGDRDRARRAVKEWKAELPKDPLAHEREGELAFLAGDYDRAVAALTNAEQRTHGLDPELSYPTYGSDGSAEELRQQVLLQLGTTLEHAGNQRQAMAAYKSVEAISDRVEYSRFDGFGDGQLGALLLNDGKYDQAAAHLRRAIKLRFGAQRASLSGAREVFPDSSILLRGSEHNNLALAAAKSGNFDLARQAAAGAVERDPSNPVFLDTAAFVQHLAGEDAAAVDGYRKALAQDPSSYVSANNLAVLLAEDDANDEAVELLEQAVKANPDYAKAWHNLGVVRSRAGSVGAFLEGQGALARAAAIDHDLRGNETALLVDDKIYDSGLDVSRTVPPDWTYAASAKETGRGFIITMALLILLRLLWVLGLDRVAGGVAERVIASSPHSGRRTAWFWRRFRPRWALAASFTVLAVPVVWGVPIASAMVFGALTIALVSIPIATRLCITRPGESMHFGWTPALAVGLVGMPFGIAIAPYPVLDSTRPDERWTVRWLPSLVLAGVTALFAVASLTTSLPYLRVAAATALALLATLLIPVPPFDGSRLKGRRAQLVVACLLTFGAVAFGLKWV